MAADGRAEVLPLVTMSLATVTWGGSSIERVMLSMIRSLAWCGMNASSSRADPGRVQRLPGDLAISYTAQRNTRCPSAAARGRGAADPPEHVPGRALADGVGLRAVRAPHTGPMPGVGTGDDHRAARRRR